jgi:hypothetical protein
MTRAENVLMRKDFDDTTQVMSQTSVRADNAATKRGVQKSAMK